MATQTTYSVAEAGQRFASLPPVIQNFLYSDDMNAALQRVGQRHNLHVDQAGALEAEVVGILLGFTEPKDFPSMLEGHLHVDATQAGLIARDIDLEVFQRIRESMKQASPATSQSKPATSAAPTTAPQYQAPRPTPTPAPTAEPPRAPMATVMPPTPAVAPVSAAPAVPSAPTPAPAPAPTSFESTLSKIIVMPHGPQDMHMHPADVAMHQPTTTMAQKVDVVVQPVSQPAPAAAPQPATTPRAYTTDPYREPIS